MQTEYIRIFDPSLQENDLQRAASIIKNRGLVVFPTETVYGLGGNGLDADAAKRISSSTLRHPRTPTTMPWSTTPSSVLQGRLCRVP